MRFSASSQVIKHTFKHFFIFIQLKITIFTFASLLKARVPQITSIFVDFTSELKIVARTLELKKLIDLILLGSLWSKTSIFKSNYLCLG